MRRVLLGSLSLVILSVCHQCLTSAWGWKEKLASMHTQVVSRRRQFWRTQQRSPNCPNTPHSYTTGPYWLPARYIKPSQGRQQWVLSSLFSYIAIKWWKEESTGHTFLPTVFSASDLVGSRSSPQQQWNRMGRRNFASSPRSGCCKYTLLMLLKLPIYHLFV